MGRYIDAEEAFNLLADAPQAIVPKAIWKVGIRSILDQCNAIDIEPKRGEWVDDEFIGQYRCSECDYYSVDEFDFCPNCGADMREREGE